MPVPPAVVALLLVLLALSALFSASESALLAMNKLRLRIKCTALDRRALLLQRLLKQKDVLFPSILSANCLVNICLSSLVAKAALEAWGARGVSAAALLTTMVLLVFGEITPKTLAARHAESLAYSLCPFIAVTFAIFRPIFLFFTFVRDCFAKRKSVLGKRLLANDDVSCPRPLEMTKVPGEKEKPSPSATYTLDDILLTAKGRLRSQCAAVFRFTDLEAASIMRPRISIVAVPETMKIEDAIALSCKQSPTEQSQTATLGEVSSVEHHTRFPVFKGTVLNITGTLYIKDTLKKEGATVASIMRKPLFILEQTKMSRVLSLLQESHQSLAIVVDEYSTPVGILTTADITKSLFGSATKFPAHSATKFPAQSASLPQEFTVEGDTLLSELQEALSLPLACRHSKTLGGYLCERLGDLPKAGDKVQCQGFLFCVKNIANHAVKEVTITPPPLDTGGEP